jgi:hypothetical protein
MTPARELVSQVHRGIALLGGQPSERVVDFFLDPVGSTAALSELGEHDGIVVRVFPPAKPSRQKPGPPPNPLWVRLARGGREIGTAAFRGEQTLVRRVSRVVVEQRATPCCDAPSCHQTRRLVTVALVLEGLGNELPEDQLVVTEERAPEGAVTRTLAIARTLSDLLDVPLVLAEGTTLRAGLDGNAEPSPPLALAQLARFTQHAEGERVILRDHATRGPRAAAVPKAAASVVLLVVALGMAWTLARALWSGGTVGELVAYGGLTALMAVSSYTFFSMAWFAAEYRAKSTPLVAVGSDKLVVSPWVAPDGTVDVRNDGRYGAAIPLGEVTDVVAAPRGKRTAVEIRTDHGRIDAVVCETADTARWLAAALGRAIEEARHGPRGR